MAKTKFKSKFTSILLVVLLSSTFLINSSAMDYEKSGLDSAVILRVGDSIEVSSAVDVMTQQLEQTGIPKTVIEVNSYPALLVLLEAYPHSTMAVIAHGEFEGMLVGGVIVSWMQIGNDLSNLQLSQYTTQIISCYSSLLSPYLDTPAKNAIVALWPGEVDTEVGATYGSMWINHVFKKITHVIDLVLNILELIPQLIMPQQSLATRLVLDKAYDGNVGVYKRWNDVNPYLITPISHLMNTAFSAFKDYLFTHTSIPHKYRLAVEIALAIPHLIQGLWDSAEAAWFLATHGVPANDDNDIYLHTVSFAIYFFKVQEKVGWWWVTIGESFTLYLNAKMLIYAPTTTVVATLKNHLDYLETLYIIPIWSHLNMEWLSGWHSV